MSTKTPLALVEADELNYYRDNDIHGLSSPTTALFGRKLIGTFHIDVVSRFGIPSSVLGSANFKKSPTKLEH
jgi:hypothetical protein